MGGSFSTCPPTEALLQQRFKPKKDLRSLSTRALFDIGATTGLPLNIGFHYDVSSDGQRFVFSTDFYQQIQTPISLVLNWQELLKVRGDR